MPEEILEPDFNSGDKLQNKFIVFHNSNPHICRLFINYAFEWQEAGHTRGSINQLFERVRWHIGVSTKSDDFKLNNNHRAFYARLIMWLEPGLAGFFRLRKQKRQCSFGPPNEELPPGEHVA